MNHSASSYRVLRLVGIGHYAPDHRAVARESRRALDARDPWLVAAAIHNVGHIARRFGVVDWVLVRAAEAAAGRRPHLAMVHAALSEMHYDVAHALPFKRRLAERDAERRFEAE